MRIENLLLNVVHETTAFGEFLAFETLSLCPIDTRCVERSLLNDEEADWLNAYHAQVHKRVAPLVQGAALAWQKGLADAGTALDELAFVETHDCFTVAELLEYEAMGLAPHGQGARVILDGVTRRDGRLPVNPSGGLKSRGHPIGATGVSQHVMAAMHVPSGQQK